MHHYIGLQRAHWDGAADSCLFLCLYMNAALYGDKTASVHWPSAICAGTCVVVHGTEFLNDKWYLQCHLVKYNKI